MVNKLVVRYSEDLRKNKITGEIYGLLKDHGIEPLEVIPHYFTKMRIFTVIYYFNKIDTQNFLL